MNKVTFNAKCSSSILKFATCFILIVGFAASSMYANADNRENGVTDLAQQAITVTGVVKDAYGEPLTGTSILEEGTTNGCITDINGRFTITVKDRNAVLFITYLGYETQRVEVGNKRNLEVIMSEDMELLDEVVVIGYGTQRKGDVTSAITSIKAEDFTPGKIGDAAELVKGKIAGLSIIKSSGNPTETSDIRLRGITTVNGSVTPLILVDGIEGSLTTVAPENIASIDVLKDGSAAAIYGTRGANGVILITTKTGRRDSHATVSYSGYASFSDWTKKSDFMDTRDIIYGLTSFDYEGYDTDWLAAVTRKAGYTQNHSLSLEGGSANSAYSANVTYSDEEGIMRKSDNRNIKMQLDFTQYAMNDILKFNFNALISRQTYTLNDNNYVYRQAIIRNPSSPVYMEDGSYHENLNLLYYYNPRSIQDEYIGDGRSRFNRMTGNITLEPIKGWQTNLMLSMKESVSTSQSYLTSQYYSILKQNDYNGSASKSEGASRSDNLELTTKYEFNKNKHRFSGLAGYSYLYTVNDGFNAGNGNFPTEAYLYNNLGLGTVLTEEDRHAWMGSYKNDHRLIGLFGRVSYGYDNRYNVLASLRHEGSSKFGENNKWASFPSISTGWTISNEEFMKDQTWLSFLKLRIGYGVTGVIPTNSYWSQYMYDYDAYGDVLSKEGNWIQTLKVSQNPNPNLKWETSREWNFGLDWSILNDRLGGSIDYYTKTTSDLLYWYNVPVPPNLYSTTLANVGEMRNNGIEVTINAVPVRTKDFEWSTTLTMSHNKNKLLSLNNDLYETDTFHEVGGLGEPISVATHCMEVGEALGTFWGLKSVGVSKDGFTLVEVSDGKGGWVVKEFNTNLNVKENRQKLGSGTPDIIMGWNNSFRFKDFHLSMQFTGQFGYKILNAQRCYYENNSVAYNRLKSAADYHPAINADGTPYIDETTGQQKMVRLSNSMGQGFWSDHLEDGDFLKLSNITLGYDVPVKGDLAKYINAARVYVSASNVFCITNYSGIDPEVSNYFLAPGIDGQDKYPTTRSFTVGVNFNF